MTYAKATSAGPPSPEIATAAFPAPPNRAIIASTTETTTTVARVTHRTGSPGRTKRSGTPRRASGLGARATIDQMVEPAAKSHTHTVVVMMLPANVVHVR